MAVRMMTSAEKVGAPNVEIVYDYPGHEAHLVRHGDTCPNKDLRDTGVIRPSCLRPTVGYASKCTLGAPLYMETTYVGRVLATGERNGYDDSDFTVTVWEGPADETGVPRTFDYASTRGWTYPNGAAVDATPDIRAAYDAHLERAAAARRKSIADAEAKIPKPGRTVKVVKGRKVKIGTVAEVFWAGPDKFARRSRYENPYARVYLPEMFMGEKFARVGLRLPDGTKVFTAATNLEVVAADGGAA